MTTRITRDFFLPIATFLGPAYLNHAFTKGTEQEVRFLSDALALEPGERVLDVGCGPGRHALALARRGLQVVGVDLSPEFIALAREAAGAEMLDGTRFEVLDVRDLDYDAEFDAALCLCQGGFGLLGGPDDAAVIPRVATALRPGGRLAISAACAYFAARFLEAGETFDPSTGVLHERTEVRGDTEARIFDLWTTCFTARELALLAGHAGLVVDGVYSVTPGDYARRPPDLDRPELLLLARRPFSSMSSDL